jgi:hypothetical protein
MDEYGIDPSHNDNVAIVNALRARQHEVAYYLYNDRRVSDSVNNDSLISAASYVGSVNLVAKLLQTRTLDRTTIITSFEHAVADGNLNLIDVFMSNDQTRPEIMEYLKLSYFEQQLTNLHNSITTIYANPNPISFVALVIETLLLLRTTISYSLFLLVLKIKGRR